MFMIALKFKRNRNQILAKNKHHFFPVPWDLHSGLWWSVTVQMPVSASDKPQSRGGFVAFGHCPYRKPRLNSQCWFFSVWGRAWQWWEVCGCAAALTGLVPKKADQCSLFCSTGIAAPLSGTLAALKVNGFSLEGNEAKETCARMWWSQRRPEGAGYQLRKVPALQWGVIFAAHSIANTCLIGAFIFICSFIEQAWLISACHHLVLTETIHF